MEREHEERLIKTQGLAERELEARGIVAERELAGCELEARGIVAKRELAGCELEARDLHVCGIVQGVGFRPFVYRQALRWNLVGWVLNASNGVHIHLEGDKISLEGFIAELTARKPQAALITSVEVSVSSLEGLSAAGFDIRQSLDQTQTDTLVSPDIATCPQCLTELFDPSNRRFHYPFTNCTNCGPRFTIINGLPYDRAQTSMASFELCAACDREYRDPLNRRFHAQPNACFDCGPALTLSTSDTERFTADDLASSDALIAQVAARIKAGQIVAIKGLGGYHIACDATNQETVLRLRKRKRRIAKPFAIMVRDLLDAHALCHVSTKEAALLSGTIRPIVLLAKKPISKKYCLAEAIAGSLPELGIMLPYTPVQHLLMAAVGRPLVMTSGNMSEEPIISAEVEAHALLGDIVDAFLDNNREILSRYDDSVVRVIDERMYMIRRARGFAPRPLKFLQAPTLSRSLATVAPNAPPHSSTILAVGAEQKNTFCVVAGKQAFVSQHLGDLENASAFAAWLSTLGLYRQLFDFAYRVIACDMHPEYLTGKWARAQKEPRTEIQHHHAHIAAVLAEQRALGEASDAGDIELIDKVIGIAFDGTGYGEDLCIWGGEVGIVSLTNFERFAHLRYAPLVGGQAAIKHPDRMAWSYLRSLGIAEHNGARGLAARLGDDNRLLLDQIIASRINSPLSSSMGRLFDAVSALVGICGTSNYEGQAAIELEAALYDPETAEPVCDPLEVHSAQRYVFAVDEISLDESSPASAAASAGVSAGTPADAAAVFSFDPTPVFLAILDDLEASVSSALISLRFHNAVVALVGTLCDKARKQTGLSTVALSGGVFMNRYLLTQLIPLLKSEAFTVLLNHELPANDGCISYGQAASAAAQMAELANTGILFEA